MRKTLFFAVIMMTALTPAWSLEEKKEGDSFLTDAISSAVKKIDKVTSGEERIIDENAKGADKDIFEYDDSGLGRPNRGFGSSSVNRQRTGQGE